MSATDRPSRARARILSSDKDLYRGGFRSPVPSAHFVGFPYRDRGIPASVGFPVTRDARRCSRTASFTPPLGLAFLPGLCVYFSGVTIRPRGLLSSPLALSQYFGFSYARQSIDYAAQEKSPDTGTLIVHRALESRRRHRVTPIAELASETEAYDARSMSNHFAHTRSEDAEILVRRLHVRLVYAYGNVIERGIYVKGKYPGAIRNCHLIKIKKK